MTDRAPAGARVHPPGSVLDVRPYDFASPELIGGDARARLDSAFEAWGRQVGMQITAKTRAVVDVAVAPCRVQTFGAFLAPDDGETLEAVGTMGEHRVVYRVPVPEARYWAARMIGAAAPGGDAGRAASAVERALALRVVEEHLAELRLSTGGLFPDVAVDAFGADAAAGGDPDGLAVTVAVGTLRRGERSRLTLAIPAAAALQALDAVPPAQDPAVVTSLIGRHLAFAPVEVALRFDDTRVGPDTVLDLAPGDLIPLAHTTLRPLVVTLDGERILRAAVGSNGDRLACVVVDSDGEPA